MAVYRYGLDNQVCEPCRYDYCEICEGTDLVPCEDCCWFIRLPYQRTFSRPGRYPPKRRPGLGPP